ncbi:hypothetical protein SprV_0802575400 [Sparganum proliferum]
MTISEAEDRELVGIRKIKNTVTLPADKGRSTVLMDKTEYWTNLESLLMDNESYALSDVSNFKKLVNNINKTDSEWTVKSAEEFLTRIRHRRVAADEVMVSFDVVSLFTSIKPDLAIDTLDGILREKYDETDQQLKRVHIIELLELCLKTFFIFKGQVYEQKKGTLMGSSLSGLIAEAVLQRLERLVFRSFTPKIWATYVDNTFVIIKRYVGEIGKRLGTRLHGHQLAINRKDKLSLVYGHTLERNHNFAFEKARVVGRANDKIARLMFESWSSSGTLNRAIDLHPAYQALRARLQSVQAGSIARIKRVTRGRLPTLAERREGADRKPRDRCGTLSHGRTHKAGNITPEEQLSISPPSDEGEANEHADAAASTSGVRGTQGTPVRQWLGSERPQSANRKQASQQCDDDRGGDEDDDEEEDDDDDDDEEEEEEDAAAAAGEEAYAGPDKVNLL